MITNGRRAAYARFARGLARRGLREAHLSLHGSRPEVHDPIVGVPGGWREAYDGLRNLLEAGVETTVNMVVCAGNLRDIRATAEILADLPIKRLRVSMTDPTGRALINPAIVPDYEEAVRAAAEFAADLPPRPRISFDGWPACRVPGTLPQADLLDCDIFAMQEVWEDRWYPCDQGHKVHEAECAGCGAASACPGVYAGYRRRGDAAALFPVERPAANSFDFALDGALSSCAGPCVIPAAARRALHPIRDIAVRLGAGLRRARTDTADFSPAEIRRTVQTLGQVYLQRGDAPFVGDFARELTLLLPEPGCQPCDRRGLSCPGAWAPAPVNVFAAVNGNLRALLTTLRGDVLDVGRGAGRFDDLFARLVAESSIRYRGIDPDAAAIATARARHPALTMEATTAEALALQPDTIDAALVLCSHNHLRDPDAVYAALARALRPGGRLIVSDNVPFALVREPAAVAAARRDEPAHPPEHRRNEDGGAVRARLAALGLAIVAETLVGPGAANHWLIEARRMVATPAVLPAHPDG